MKTRAIPMRKCIGCMESRPKGELLRIVCAEGRVSADPTGRAAGRGAYLCKNTECLEKAIKRRAFGRAFKCEVKAEDLERLRGVLDEEN